MKYFPGIVIILLGISGQLFAQEKDTLNQLEISVKLMQQSANDRRGMTEREGPDLNLPGDFKSGLLMSGSRMAELNFDSSKKWKIGFETSFGISSFNLSPFRDNLFGYFGNSMWNYPSGSYGTRTYRMNNKFSFGTAGYSGKRLKDFSGNSGIYKQTNYSSSLFVGYKFSDKFSISAGVTVGRYHDPFGINP